VESFSRPSVSLAAAILGLIALIGFAVGFKGSFSRPGEIEPRFTAAGAPSSSMAEPTQAQALTEPTAPLPAEPSSAAAPKAKPKPAPDADDDNEDTATAAPVQQVLPPPPVIMPAPPPAPPADDDLPPH
jgi:hypothetical protein